MVCRLIKLRNKLVGRGKMEVSSFVGKTFDRKAMVSLLFLVSFSRMA